MTAPIHSDSVIVKEVEAGLAAGKTMEQIARVLGYSEGSPLKRRYKRIVSGSSAERVVGSADPELRSRLAKAEAELRQLRLQDDKMRVLKQLIHEAKDTDRTPPEWLSRHAAHSGAWHHGTPVLFLSDLHWGETVFQKQVNGVNAYNLEIAQERLRRVVETSMSLLFEVLSKPSYDGIVLALGGDMVSGNIHEELRETNAAPINVVVLDLLDNLIAAVDKLLTKFKRVFIPCVTGNHGRLDRKPRAKNAVYDNFEWTLYQLLARHYVDDKRVTVLVADSADIVFKVHNTRILLTHGDQFSGGSGISGPLVPWSLGNARKSRRQNAIGQPYDVMIFGHWHSLAWGPGDAWVANGSLKGYDEYAFRNNFGFEPAQQALFVVHPRNGITFRMGVLADKRPEPKAAEWVSVRKPGDRA